MAQTPTYNNESRQKLMLAGQVEKLLKGLWPFLNFRTATNSSGVRRFRGHDDTAFDAFAESCTAHATGEFSHAEGYETVSSGENSHAEGNQVEASGDDSHAEGTETEAQGDSSHAEGRLSKARSYAHAEGHTTRAYGSASHSEGYYTYAAGDAAHAEGNECEAAGNAAHVEGMGCLASSACQSVEGKYNVEDTDGVYAHIIGDGSNDENRHNLMTVDWNGNMEISGNVYVGGCESNEGEHGTPIMTFDDTAGTPGYYDVVDEQWKIPTPNGFVYGGSKYYENVPATRELVVFTTNQFKDAFHVDTAAHAQLCFCAFSNGDAGAQPKDLISTNFHSSSGWAAKFSANLSAGEARINYIVFVPKQYSTTDEWLTV